jgi:hypothetical protein
MNEFWDTDTKEYKYKILVYPNITYQKDLEKDSYVVVLSNVIKTLSEMRDDIYWVILTPYKTKSLTFHNTEQRILDLPTYPNSMRTHFNVFDIKKVIDWKTEDFDIVYSHLPEHTLQLKNYFHNLTNITPKFIGYCHWYEVKENTNYEKTMFHANIAGTLEMDEVGVNSDWLKSLILDRASKYYTTDVISKLDKIIKPHYLGIDTYDMSSPQPVHKKILFNHRDNAYTGWGWFKDAMIELLEERNDFEVITTLIDAKHAGFRRVSISDRVEYLNFLKGIYVGVGCFEKYSAWSISTTDGLSQGVPYILPNSLCYPEMIGDDYPLLYSSKDEFKQMVRDVLDNPQFRSDAKEFISDRIAGFTWDGRVSKWFSNWDVFNFDGGARTETYDKVKKFIMSRGTATKEQILEHIRWGKTFSFNKYRNLLREDDDILLTRWGYAKRIK